MRFFLMSSLIVLLCSCSIGTKETHKINGVSFVSFGDSITKAHIKPISNINSNYAAIMPFGFVQDINHPEIIYNSARQWFGETENGVKQYVESLKKQHIKVMIKPQIWVRGGEFTGLIHMKTEDEWLQLEHTYSQYILKFAAVAEAVNAEIFCVGTELEGFVENRPNYWKQLIVDVQNVYSGKITYAANWNEYEKIPFWSQLDYIGIDAYFPISSLKTPTVEDCKTGWLKYKPTMENLSITLSKPVLFTEFGYRSVDFTGKEPWESSREMKDVNLAAQTNATKALLETFWGENWFAGGFVWKWHHDYPNSGGPENTMFTPQNKPAEVLLKETYSNY